MKTKATIILKSLADLPANTLTLAASVPGRAMKFTKQMLTPPVQATRRQIRTARQHSADIFRDIYIRAHTPMRDIIPWSRGGLNE
jgi:hypothetical protein